MSIKTVNSLIIANKHEEAYKALLNIKPSFQVMITKTAAEDEDASVGVKQLSEEMKKMGIEEMAVIIYDGNTDPSHEVPTPYPDAVDAQLEQKVVLIIADVDSFKTDELVISYNETVEDLGSNNLVFAFPDEVKDLVNDCILYATDYDLDNCILVLRSSQMEYVLRSDETAFKDCQKQTQNTIYVSRDATVDDGRALIDIFNDLSNLPSEKYKHILKIHDYESNQDPVYYSDTWIQISHEVDRISGALFNIAKAVKPLKEESVYVFINESSILKQRFFAEAVYRNMVFIHVDYLPNVNKPINNKQQVFYDACKLAYSSTLGFIADIINPLDIAKVLEMKKEHEENTKKVDILSIPPDAGMEFLPA